MRIYSPRGRKAQPRRSFRVFAGLGVAAILFSSAGALSADCVASDQGGCLPIAPDSARVDLVTPSFSDPTDVTNPLFPISNLHSAVLLGHVEGSPLRIEVTLLPETETISWDGNQTETVVSQFVAYLDGRIHEVAIDRYAQDDAGNVWYFGEDVFNYEDGQVADTDGTWLAGKDGPPAMIMPADPQTGDVFRPENMPGFVFEQVTVVTTDTTVSGPFGPVAGAIVARELHQDGAYEDKIFAPGYGEFRSSGGGDLEALALAVPTDASPEPAPAAVETLFAGADQIFAAAETAAWDEVASGYAAMFDTWAAHRAGAIPDLLEYQMSEALNLLNGAIDLRDLDAVRRAAIAVGHASLDLQLAHRAPAEVDLARLKLWTDLLRLDAQAGDQNAARGDVTSMEWNLDRIAGAAAPAVSTEIDEVIGELRASADAGDLAATAATAIRLRGLLNDVAIG